MAAKLAARDSASLSRPEAEALLARGRLAVRTGPWPALTALTWPSTLLCTRLPATRC